MVRTLLDIRGIKRDMRTIVFAAMALSAAGLLGAAMPRAHGLPSADGPVSAPVPVIVELFTSEGCSSCPPADEVLTKLVAAQPVAGAHVIALGEHVDYWDRLGWRDPFSSAEFSRRQSLYATGLFHVGGIYTPQMVVDGRQEFIGSDYRAATAAIARAAAVNVPRVQLSLALSDTSRTSVRVTVQAVPPGGRTPERASDVWLAVTEDGLESRVQRGENNGRTLRHTAVVRTLARLGAMAPGDQTWSATRAIALAADWTPRAIQFVAFAQDPSTHQILGAAALKP